MCDLYLRAGYIQHLANENIFILDLNQLISREFGFIYIYIYFIQKMMSIFSTIFSHFISS